MKSLEPYEKKLGTDTWYYAKRCFLGLAETLAKHMLMLKVRTSSSGALARDTVVLTRGVPSRILRSTRFCTSLTALTVMASPF